jgi:hypothetical protein
LEHPRDGRRHRDLAVPGLEVGHGARQRAIGGEDRCDYSG